MQRQRQGQRHAMQRVTFARDVPVSLIFCLLVMIKCGICSYQCDPPRRLATPRHATLRHATPMPTPTPTPPKVHLTISFDFQQVLVVVGSFGI
jgi:hypothetical protein